MDANLKTWPHCFRQEPTTNLHFFARCFPRSVQSKLASQPLEGQYTVLNLQADLSWVETAARLRPENEHAELTEQRNDFP